MIRLGDYSVKREGFTIDIPELVLDGKKNFIIGRNGSGKTTLLQSLAGLVESSGVFEVNGENINDLPTEKRNIGFIPQDLLLFGKMTVENNLLSSVKYGKGEMAVYSELVDRMEIASILSKRSNEISMGQAQRVAIARAIISRPSVLLMDEPFSFQDEIARLGLISLIDELSEKYSFEYIYATHNSRDLETGFSALVSIDNGRLIESVESISNVKHFRTLSLLDYKNLASIEGRYFVLSEESLEFNDSEGSEYDVVGNESNRYVRFKIGSQYFFASVKNVPRGRLVRIDINRTREIEY